LLYLPLALREECTPGQQHVDAAVIIDASTSMLEPTADDLSKLRAAQRAVGNFLHGLQLDAGDQAAIIAFNSKAWTEQWLTADRRALQRALERIVAAPQTCLVCAVDVAARELTSNRHNPESQSVMILLTDGKSNPQPVSQAVDRAAEAKLAGITIFTIGLGEDLNLEALEAIASNPSYFYRAPDGEDLREIYAAIAVEIPCPADEFWGRR
jgi:Mg-chelatase subunit ChlD